MKKVYIRTFGWPNVQVCRDDIGVAEEDKWFRIKRIHKKYGPLAILVQGDGHGECKFIHAAHGCPTLLLDKMGGFTQQVRNPDSWEGWYWGAKHVWGPGLIGMMAPNDNIVKDICDNSDMVVVWGGDPETTPW